MFHYVTPLFGFLSRFRAFKVLLAFVVGKVFFLGFLRVTYQETSANQWYIGRLALDYFALCSTSDAAPSSFVPRFQRSGDSNFFFAS